MWVLLLAASSGFGCVTVPAAVDLVVPSPLTAIEVRRASAPDELVWVASYGKTNDFAPYLRSREMTRRGRTPLPPSLASCSLYRATQGEGAVQPGIRELRGELMPLRNRSVVRSYLPDAGARSELPADTCAYFVVAPADEGAVVLYDQQGRVVQRMELPSEAPFLHWKRWFWLAAAPLMDGVYTAAFLYGMPSALLSRLFDSREP
jgi:hypothetical protein